MDLDTYLGASPAENPSLTVEHVTHHRRWSPKQASTDTCPNCEREFELANRHVLVTLAGDAAEKDRHYFCSEPCVGEWLADDAA
jgi:hypothetical protein